MSISTRQERKSPMHRCTNSTSMETHFIRSGIIPLNSRGIKGVYLRTSTMLDKHQYEGGIKISDKEMSQLNLTQHPFHGEWNYTIKPSIKVYVIWFQNLSYINKFRRCYT